MGDVYITLYWSLKAVAIAYSATAVLPADVWAATSTDWCFSKQSVAAI